MTQYSKYPSWVEFNYRSAFGAHSQEICTLQWIDAASVGGAGQFNVHSGDPIDAAAMIVAMVDVLKVFHPTTTTIDSATIFNMPTEDSRPQPVKRLGIDEAGTNAGTGWAKAVQTTFSLKSLAFNPAKIVLLDCPVPANNWNKITTLIGSAELIALIGVLSDPENGWAARDGERVPYFVSATYDLNDKLRKSYGMA